MTRAVLWALVLAAASAAQATRPASRPAQDSPVVLLDAPRALLEPQAFHIGPDPLPRLLLIRGTLDDSADAAFELAGVVWGMARGFMIDERRFEAALPLAGGTEPMACVLRPVGRGAVAEQILVIAAARVRFVVRDQATKEVIPGIACVRTMNGRDPLRQGPVGGWPREGAAWIAADGNGDLYVTPDADATFEAHASPFRGRRTHDFRVTRRDRLVLTFLLPADQLPADAVILEAPARPGVSPEALRAADLARGIGRRTSALRAVRARDLLEIGPGLVDLVLAFPDEKYLATNELGPRMAPEPDLVTAELPGGELLHSNGPVILFVDRRREGAAIRAWVKVRLPEGVLADKLVIAHGAERQEHVLAGPSTIPLDVAVPPGTPIALFVTGPARRREAPHDRPLAFRVFRAP